MARAAHERIERHRNRSAQTLGITMNKCAILILFVFLVGFLSCQHARGKAKEWFAVDMTDIERDSVVTNLKEKPFAEIAQETWRAIIAYGPWPSGLPVGKRPWMSSRYTPEEKIFLMAYEIWDHHLSQEDTLERTQVLLNLLQNSEADDEIMGLLYDLGRAEWDSCAELPVSAMLEDEEVSLEIKRNAIEVLLERCDINKYMPKAIAIIMKHEKGLPQVQAFNFITNQGNRLFALSAENRKALLVAGFKILNELPKDNLKLGYFVAARLGFILKIKGEFVPDPGEEKYQGKYQLKDTFFEDTTRNALQWYAKNQHVMENN
ncbi:hypothetical protein ACFL4W_05310 [Planctomycetota bacterium]